MSRIALSDAGEWKLEFPDSQDIRGFRALDADGNAVGTVDTMIVNTEQKRVDAVVLEDGTEYPASDLSIGEGVVYLTTVSVGPSGVNSSVRVYGDDGQVIRRVAVEDGDYDAHTDAFRTHYGSSYADADGTYDDLEPAYRYGYESAHGDQNRNRPFVDAADDLRTEYGTRHGDRDYDADMDAIRYGYTRAQHATR